jgi:predicted site-specific integrase-resolvase
MSQTEEERRKTQSSNAVAENMRAKEAHKYLGISLSGLWLFVKQGKISAFKLSDKVTIFKKKDLDRFINEAVEVVS